MKFRAWVEAARLRTLPLAISGVLLGFTIPTSHTFFRYDIGLMCLVTAFLLQILSNFSNDYGDYLKGTDNEKRIGQPRALQQGLLSVNQLKTALYIVSVFSFIAGLYLLYISDINWVEFVFFLAIGMSAIWAAIYYTVGKNAYGYKGWGDMAVAIFFGPAVVCGTGYLMLDIFSKWYFFLSITSACFSAAVLHLNNMRDCDNDLVCGKKTLAVKLGYKNSILYLIIILIVGYISSLLFIFSYYNTIWNFLILFTLIPIISIIRGVIINKPSSIYNSLLKRMVITTFIHSTIILWIGWRN